MQNRRLDKEAQSHIVSKPNKRVMKSCLNCLKLEAPEMSKKKPPLSLPIKQLVSNLKRSTKALLWKGAGMIIFFG